MKVNEVNRKISSFVDNKSTEWISYNSELSVVYLMSVSVCVYVNVFITLHQQTRTMPFWFLLMLCDVAASGECTLSSPVISITVGFVSACEVFPFR